MSEYGVVLLVDTAKTKAVAVARIEYPLWQF